MRGVYSMLRKFYYTTEPHWGRGTTPSSLFIQSLYWTCNRYTSYFLSLFLPLSLSQISFLGEMPHAALKVNKCKKQNDPANPLVMPVKCASPLAPKHRRERTTRRSTITPVEESRFLRCLCGYALSQGGAMGVTSFDRKPALPDRLS